MKCQQTDQEHWAEFRRKVATRRIPLSGSIELTRRCNLRCVHCYLGGLKPVRKNSPEPFSTAQWMKVIDEFSEAGCLHLLITGGEPLLRSDFPEIYVHAKKKGLIITIFSNGTRITEPIIELFQDFPPFHVEISLYGATPETYERISRVKGSYRRCIQGIEKLLKGDIHLNLKTVLMAENLHEFEKIEKKAKDYGVGFRFDAAITPCLDGDPAPLRGRVTPETVIEKEFSDPDRSRKWTEYYRRSQSFFPSEILYDCGAGLFSFHVSARGGLQPCLMTEEICYNLVDGSFFEGWNNVIPRIKEKKADVDNQCFHCICKPLCGFCPALFQLENGSADIPSAYICELGKKRLNAIQTSTEDMIP